MEIHEKKHIEFLHYFAKKLSRKCKQEIISTSNQMLHKFHYTLGLRVRNQLFYDKELLDAFKKTYDESDPDKLSMEFLKDLKLYLQQKINPPAK